MLKKIKFLLESIMILSIIFLGGCNSNEKLSKSKVEQDDSKKKAVETPTQTQKDSNKDVNIRIWSWFSLKDTIKGFESENSGITVKEELFTFDECRIKYAEALSSGEGPDVLMFDSGFFGEFTVSGILQDLLKEPFGAGKYQKDFLGWESGFSVNNKELLSLSYSTSPMITTYRSDIMEENGFPSEPDEFGRFIEKPENIMQMARKLKEKDKYIFQYPTDITDLVGATRGYFDKELNCIRHGDMFVQALDMAKEIHKDKTALGFNFWDINGKEAVKEDKLVMITNFGSYMPINIEEYVPEQKGKWRITKPILGVAVWASDSRLAINSQSKNKEQAWKLMEYVVTHKYNKGELINVVPSYIPVIANEKNMTRKEAYLGDQNAYPIIKQLAEKMVQYKITPMDMKVNNIYTKQIWDALSRNVDMKDVMENMKKTADTELLEEKRALKE